MPLFKKTQGLTPNKDGEINRCKRITFQKSIAWQSTQSQLAKQTASSPFRDSREGARNSRAKKPKTGAKERRGSHFRLFCSAISCTLSTIKKGNTRSLLAKVRHINV